VARILLDQTEIEVSEEAEEILTAIVNSRDGLRSESGRILSPPGWLSLTQPGLGEAIYVQVSHIGYVRED
jgi:hypothetical protein